MVILACLMSSSMKTIKSFCYIADVFPATARPLIGKFMVA